MGVLLARAAGTALTVGVFVITPDIDSQLARFGHAKLHKIDNRPVFSGAHADSRHWVQASSVVRLGIKRR